MHSVCCCAAPELKGAKTDEWLNHCMFVHLQAIPHTHVQTRVGIYTSFGPSIPVYTCIYTDTRIYGLNTYDD